MLGSVVVLLVTASMAGQLTSFLTGHDHVYGLVQKFFLGAEANIPTWFASVILLMSAALLAVIAAIKRSSGAPFARHWMGLALIFVYISMDEAASLHELSIRPLRELLGIGGVFYFAWIIPASLLLLLFAISYWRFLFALPSRSRILFSAAAVLYVGGAVGVEMIGGRHHDLHGGDNLTYRMIQTVEETLEMSGIVLFIYALLQYMAATMPTIRFHVEGSGDRTAAGPRPGDHPGSAVHILQVRKKKRLPGA